MTLARSLVTGDAVGIAGLRVRVLPGVLISVALVAAVMSSLGAPLIPTMAKSSGVSLGTADWLLTATLLTGALATPVMGRLADGPHQRGVVATALIMVLAGAVLAASSSVFAVLVTGRALQGFGFGLMPVTMAIARRNLPPQRAGRTIAMLSITAVMGIGLGYPATGLIAEFWDYHAAFWAGAIVVGAALATSTILLPRDVPAPSRHFDTFGAVLLSASVTMLILALSEGSSWGWGTPPVLALLILSAVALAVWCRYELGQREPLVDLRQARHRMVLTADLAGFLISMAMYLFLPIIVEFVQVPTASGYGFGASVLVGACVLVPLSAGTLVASRLTPSFERRFGRRPVIPVGSAIFAVAMVVFAVEHGHLWEAFVVTALGGMGVGFTFAAMPGFIVEAIDARDTGSAMGFYQIVRSIGLAVGSATSAAILAGFTHGSDLFPEVNAFKTTLLGGAGICLVAGIVAYLLPGAGARSRVVEPLTVESGELGGAGLPFVNE